MATRPCPSCGRPVDLSEETWAILDEYGKPAYACEAARECVPKVRDKIGYNDDDHPRGAFRF